MTVPVLPNNATLHDVIFAVQRLTELVRDLDERNLDNVSGWSGNQSNVTTDRTFDADITSTAELADVLGTLISDLVNKRVLR